MNNDITVDLKQEQTLVLSNDLQLVTRIVASITLLTMQATNVILLLAFTYTKKHMSIVNKCKDIKTVYSANKIVKIKKLIKTNPIVSCQESRNLRWKVKLKRTQQGHWRQRH